MLRQRVLGSYRRALTGVNLDELAAAGSQVMSDGLARTTSELARAVADRWPDTDPQALGAVLIPGYVRAVQIPPRGLWRTPGAAKYALLSDWVHARVTAPNEDPTDPVGQAVILRYLEAFGPAAVSDIRAWSGLTRLDIPVAALRERLVSFHDERGRELLDLPDAPRPDVDVTAPVRFLPAFDNAMLGYDNRDRIVDDEHRHVSVDGHRVVLVDGRVAATWAVHDTVLEVSPFQKLRRAARSELTVEGHALAHFLSDGAHDRVRIH